MSTRLSVFHKPQRGVALVTSLILLVLLTILAISSLSTTTLQERMAGNTGDALVSFSAAESVLRTAETWIGSPVQQSKPEVGTNPSTQTGQHCNDSTAPNPPCRVWQRTTTTYPTSATSDEAWDTTTLGISRYRSTSWWDSHAIVFSTAAPSATAAPQPCNTANSALAGVAAQPCYVIEEVGSRNFSNSLTLDPTNTYQYYYQVTARAVGARAEAAGSVVTIQSIYGRIF